MKSPRRIGVDTGGTFTDFVILDRKGIRIRKIPSSPENPSNAILAGLQGLISTDPPISIVHGTTVATNALLERRGGRTALVTTRGFEDILHIGRQTRNGLYRFKPEPRRPLIRRRLCFGIVERTSASGEVLTPVSEADIRQIGEHLRKAKVEAAAVSLINAYANPANERIIRDILIKMGFQVSASSDIIPEHREYERTTAAAVNAYLQPVISLYLSDLEQGLKNADLRVMQSNEGSISPATARREPIRTALSGPAGGVVAAHRVARLAGFRQILTFDMGGTSSDVSMIDGRIRRTNEGRIGEFPIRLPMIDIHTVGAGGGSIVHIDRGGSLRVGPQSAGADPGPACYGKGTRPTVTDANLVLGRLSPDFFLGGEMPIHPDRSFRAVKSIADRIGRDVFDTAAGIVAIANANMEKAIRVISIERGIDPRRFTLFSFGGAGGMHAAEMARHLDIDRVLIPKNAGVLSALGLLMAESIKDYSLSLLQTADQVDPDSLAAKFRALAEKGTRDMQKEGFSEQRIHLQTMLDLRYLGQSFEITIPYRNLASSLTDFHRTHKRVYTYRHSDRPVEIVNLRLKAVGTSRKVRLQRFPAGGKTPDQARFKDQDIFFQGRMHRASVYDRARLEPENIIPGPALIVDYESTTLLPPAHHLEVDAYLNLILTHDGKAND